jgi:signal transduction histidine kinase
VIGHNLTALCLHLEGTLHVSGDQLNVTLQKALSLAKQLLSEVRTLVSGFEDGDRIDLRTAFDVLQKNVPRIALAIQIPDNLAITESARAHAVVRCVQEITTNTLKHSDARNLWINICLRNGAIEIDAHDDGSKVERKKPGIGISNMRQRLEELGGGLEIDTTSLDGFRLKAWLPARSAVETS